jgi:hypothetical protein
MNYDRTKKYFEPLVLKPAIITIVIGAVIFLIGLGAGAGVAIVGLIVAGIGGFLIYSKTSGRPTDSEIDQICSEHVKGLKGQALNKIGLDEDQVKEADPITFDGYYYKNVRSGCLYQTGKDKIVRSSTYEAVMFFFSAEQVYCYEYRFSIVADEKQETTEEYFYRDIVAAATKSETVTYKVDGKDENFNYEKFTLTTSGGTSISASILDMGNADRSIKGMKNLLRNKKQQLK